MHPKPTSTAPETIQPFAPGSLDSPLSASRMNDMVALMNVLAAMRGENHVVVQRAEGNMVVKLDDEFKGQIESVIVGQGGGAGLLNFRGEWSSATDYLVGDIVIYPAGTAPSDGQDLAKAGTYVCVQSHQAHAPPDYATRNNAYWETVAVGHWAKLVLGTAAAYPKTTILPGDMTMVLDSYGTKIDIDPAAVPTTGRGKAIGVREIQVCEDGVTRKVLILASQAYD